MAARPDRSARSARSAVAVIQALVVETGWNHRTIRTLKISVASPRPM